MKFSSGYAGLYTLSSSDPAVAEIDANGNVIARGEGTATITVSLDQKPGVVKTTTVTVKAAPQSILSSRDQLMLAAGQKSSAIYGVNPEPENSHCGYTYSSSDPEVVQVDPVTGELSAIAKGRAEITICADNNPDASAVCAVTVIEMQAASRLIGVGDSLDLQEMILHPDGTGMGEYSFSSGKKTVATVSSEGIVKGKKAGTANITVKSADGLSVKVKVTVRKYATSGRIKLTPSELILGEGMNGKLTAQFSSGYYGLYELTSSNPDCVQVDAEGNLLAFAPGDAEITLRLEKSSVVKTARVRVLPAPERIEASVSELTLGLGQVSSALTGVNPEPDTSMCAFLYESSAPEIVSVDENGQLTASQLGEADIFIAASNNPDAKAQCRVQVLPAPQSLQLEKKSLTIGKGDSFDLNSLIQIPEGTAAGYSFSSSAKSYVSVTAAGVIKGVKKGSATITVKTHNGQSEKIKVTVRSLATASRVKLTPAELILGEGMQDQLTFKFNSGYYALYELTSSNEDCVKVQADGTLQAVAPGEAEISLLLLQKNSIAKTAKVRVLPAPERIEASATELILGLGQVSTALTGINPEPEASMCSFVYASSDESIALVDPSTGAITAVGLGSCEIIAAASNNPQATAACSITVVPDPESISFDGVRTSIGVKEKYQLDCLLLPEGSAGSLKYKSSKTSVASISADGVITGKQSGTTKITVTAHNGAVGSFTLTVTAAPGSIQLSAPRTELGVGESLQFAATIPGSRAGEYRFSSSDESVLTIDAASGLAQAVGAGYADVNVETYNGKKASLKILVLNAPESMVIEPQQAVIGAGDTFTVAAAPNSGAAGAYSFESLNPEIAWVDASTGEITAISEGTATIIATAYNGASGSMQLQVAKAPSSVQLSGLTPDQNGAYALSLYRGEEYQLAVDPGEYTHVSVEFISRNADVAAVSADGRIAVKGSGSTQIIVRTYNGAETCIQISVKKWTDAYKAKSFAHALGGINNKSYSNSLEAFKLSYKNGFRIIEADFSYTSDGEIVLWHDWKKDQINSKTKLGYVPTAAEFAKMKIYDKYTSVSYRDLLKLMQVYPDFYLITDTKYDDAATVKKQFSQMVSIAREMGCEQVLDRFIVQVYNQKMLSVVKGIYPFRNYIFTLYNLYSKAPTIAQFEEAAAFCSKNGVDLITMPKGWWSTKYLNLMSQYNVDVAVHTVNSASEAKKFFNQGVKAIYTDYLSAKGT